MSKYLKDDEIKVNHIYVDNKGIELIYLGTATQDAGYWSYPKSHIYIKRDRLRNYPNTMSLDEILSDLEEKGVRHYCFSEKHRKLVSDIGIDPRPELHGCCANIFEFD